MKENNNKYVFGLIFIFIVIPILLIISFLWGMYELQFSGPVYSCLDQKIEYGHVDPNNLDDVIDFSNEATSRLLTFSMDSDYKSFDKLSFNYDEQTKTHCVYYATTYKQIFDYVISKGNLNATCTIKRDPIQHLEFIPQFFKLIGNKRLYNFTKDHDYCVINDSIKIDPTLYDVLH